MITCKEDLIGTYSKNDNGELLSMYIDKCLSFGFHLSPAFSKGKVVDDVLTYVAVGIDGDSVWAVSNHYKAMKNQLTLEDLKPQTKDVEWVNGLPPVGAECELSNCGNSWVKAEVLFMGTGLCVVNQGYGDQHYHLNSVKFRKPETPEQKLEREFKNSTEELLRGKVKFNNDLLPSTIARVLFNAGYRKG